MNIIPLAQASQFTQSTLFEPKRWTAVIPAAGRGSRLGYSKPKILYPIAGRTILDWLIDLLEPQCARLVFVLSPAGSPEVTPLIEARLGKRGIVALQDEPKGMAHAIAQALPHLTTANTLILWGDQASIQPTTLHTVLRTHESTSDAQLTLPLVQRPEPYVHYECDAAGRFVRVLHRREGDQMPAVGTSDCGLFAVSTSRLLEIFHDASQREDTTGASTGEWNFLPMLPSFETDSDSVIGILLDSIGETIGINDVADASKVESFFRELTQ